ncbi:hypothetical protein CTAM01_11904 [Colletotrichum tamarilloi]|uniref:Uncharacterized protein n=1 Tax=Colletotrichum tamarilloi TaxID=1209934 RepID=A0ABQ9QWB5_9PEZI|nr:uncharacterized protein CTAM01_11904 [Colletotrichum tamarilloi]KAI3532904.1 hypothetical protein CSPX01_13109 [Colletotrichum filicis]KAK1487133.1 hypothetical protein CTAM01_11904 [Colletotrichum tamarilloi]
MESQAGGWDASPSRPSRLIVVSFGPPHRVSCPYSSGAAPSHMPVPPNMLRDSARPMPRGIPGLVVVYGVGNSPCHQHPRHCHIACSEPEIGH